MAVMNSLCSLRRRRQRSDVESLVASIRAAISQQIAVPDGVVSLAVSVGMAMGPAEFRTSDDVIEAANRAMYAAKRGG